MKQQAQTRDRETHEFLTCCTQTGEIQTRALYRDGRWETLLLEVIMRNFDAVKTCVTAVRARLAPEPY